MQYINPEQFSPFLMEEMDTFFEDLESRMARLEQIDDQRLRGRNGSLPQVDDAWHRETSSADALGMSLSERVARLEDTNRLERLLQHLDRLVPSSESSDDESTRPDAGAPIETRPVNTQPVYYQPSPSIIRFRDCQFSSGFYQEHGFPARGVMFMTDEESLALSRYFIATSACMTSMSSIAKIYLEVKASFRRSEQGILKSLTASRLTQEQTDELQFLKLVFYELAKTSCQRIIKVAVHSRENYKIDVSRLYYLIKDSKMIDDHRSSLLSPARLFKTALRRALSNRIKFKVVRDTPVSVEFLALKADMRRLTFKPSPPKTIRIQNRVGGYSEFSAIRFRRFCEKYQDHIPDYFQFELTHSL